MHTDLTDKPLRRYNPVNKIPVSLLICCLIRDDPCVSVRSVFLCFRCFFERLLSAVKYDLHPERGSKSLATPLGPTVSREVFRRKAAAQDDKSV